MPTLSAIAHRLTRTVTLFAGTGDDELHIAYYPGAFNASAMEQWNATAERANAAGDDAEAEAAALEFGALLCRILASWDLTDDDGGAFPLTAERIVAEFLRQPLVWPAFLQTVIQAIADDMNVGKANGTASSAPSGATSSPMATSTSSRAKRSRKSTASSLSRAGSMARRPLNGSSHTRSGSSTPTSVA